jgi:hypothetical protein
MAIVLGVTVSIHVSNTTTTDTRGNLERVIGAVVNAVDDAISGNAQVKIGDTATTDAGYQLVGIRVTVFLAVNLGVTISVDIRNTAATDTCVELLRGVVGASIVAIQDLVTVSVNIGDTAPTDTRIGVLVGVSGTSIIAILDVVTITIVVRNTTATDAGVSLVDITVTLFLASHPIVTIGVDVLNVTATDTRGSFVTVGAGIDTVGDTIGISVVIRNTTATRT